MLDRAVAFYALKWKTYRESRFAPRSQQIVKRLLDKTSQFLSSEQPEPKSLGVALNFAVFKVLAKRRRKLTQVEDLGQLGTSFGQGLRATALTCDDLRSLWSRSNLQPSRRKFFIVWPPNPSQHKLSNVH